MSRLIEGLESIKVLFDTKAKQSENAGYWKDFAGIIADAILTITEKTQRIENMETMIEDMEERIAIMTEGGWCPDWHFFTFRPATDEEKEYYGMEDYDDATMLENCPCDGEEVILLTPWGMSIDTYHWDIDGSYFDEHDDIEKGWAWTATPKLPKEGEA